MVKCFIAILFCLCTILSAQNINKDLIKNSDKYYWGEAESANELEANDEALSLLTRQIAVTVSSSFEGIVTENNSTITESAKKVISTYSSATLKDVKTVTEQRGAGRILVFKYITKDEVNSIFNERLKLIHRIYIKARELEDKNNFAFALKWYYFLVILRNSIPNTHAVYEGTDFDIELPFRINNIISNIEFRLSEDKMISDKERELKFQVRSGGKPVQMLDFSFWDGTGQLNISVLDGVGIVRLFGASTKFDKLDLNIKYSYYESRLEIKEVGEVWNFINKPSFRNSKQVKLTAAESALLQPMTQPAKVEETSSIKDKASGNEAPTEDSTDILTALCSGSIPEEIMDIKSGKFSLNLTNKDKCGLMKKIGKSAGEFLKLISEKPSGLRIRQKYPDEALFSKIRAFLKYNNPVPAENEINADINKTSFGWELRKIKLLNSYASIKKQSPEYLILDFDNDGELYDISFGINESLYKEFTDQSKYAGDWGNRQIIIKFIEKYRTAFLTRDIAMLDSLFAEDAVIIIGKVLSKKQSGEMYRYIKLNDQQPDVKYMYYTKEQYLKNQKEVFENQKDIYVGYSTFKINKKNNIAGVYGVSMRQNYNATNYADEGYLFLLIDFNEDLPQIYVRSWQPQEWDDDALIKLSNFNLNK